MERLLVTRERLDRNLAACGLRAGDTVLMHSGLKAIGRVEGGADSVIDALLALLGPEGTLMVPAFSYSFAGRPGVIPFDAQTTPGLLNGAIADRLHERPDAVQSAHPSHRFAAIGKQAGWLCGDHQPPHAVSDPSPLTRLLALDGRIFFLGCGPQWNVMLHLAEAQARFRYDHLPYDAAWGEDYLIAAPGGPVRVRASEHPGCDSRFPLAAEVLLQAGRGVAGCCGEAQTLLFSAREMLETGADMLARQPDIFLCADPECPACGRRRDYLRQIGAI